MIPDDRYYCPHCGDGLDLTRNHRNEVIMPIHGHDAGWDGFEKCEGSYEVVTDEDRKKARERN